MVKFDEQHHEEGSGIVEWSPPNMNWNPWINQPVIIEGAEEYQVISSVETLTLSILWKCLAVFGSLTISIIALINNWIQLSNSNLTFQFVHFFWCNKIC